MPRKETTTVKFRSHGRITIPAAIRRRLGIKSGDTLFIYGYPDSSIWIGKTPRPEDPDLPDDFVDDIKAAKKSGKFKPFTPRQKCPKKKKTSAFFRESPLRGAAIDMSRNKDDTRTRSIEELRREIKRGLDTGEPLALDVEAIKAEGRKRLAAYQESEKEKTREYKDKKHIPSA